MIDRPMPPADLAFGSPAFAPAEGMDDFVRRTFLEPDSALYIPEHEILTEARIGYLWAAPEAHDRGRTILGTAQLLAPPQRKWSSLRSRAQLDDWFGAIDFLITLSAPACLELLDDGEFLALLDHELCHCCQAERDGIPLFSRDTGLPLWAIRGHDVEQFVGVASRWGSDAAGIRSLVEAAKRKPMFGDVDIRRVMNGCGTRIGMAA